MTTKEVVVHSHGLITSTLCTQSGNNHAIQFVIGDSIANMAEIL